MKYVQMYVIALIIFAAIDAVWLGLISPKFYKAQIGHLMTDKPNFIAAIIFYIVFIVGMVYFVVNPAIEAKSISKVVISGALFGLIAYATYDLTNLATLKDWPLKVTIVDLVWGTSLSTLIGLFTYLIYNALF